MRQANPSPPTPPKRPGRRQRDSRVTEGTQYSDFLAPKYWGAWLFIGFMYVIGYIPGKVRIGLAHILTPLAMRLARSRHHIAKTNIDLCFPEKTEAERKKLVRDTFFANVLGFFETADSWVRPIERMRSRVHWEGVEHLDAAEKDGQGVLLVGGHFAILDMAGALFGLIKPYDLVYRKHDNALLNYFMTRSRERWCERTLARRDMKGLIRSLREGRIVWYAPDQDYGRHCRSPVEMTSPMRPVLIPGWKAVYGKRQTSICGCTSVLKPGQRASLLFINVITWHCA